MREAQQRWYQVHVRILKTPVWNFRKETQKQLNPVRKEIQNKNLESSLVQNVEDICFHKVEILQTFNEEPETEF